MAESDDAMLRLNGQLMRVPGVLKGLPGMLSACQVILLSALFGGLAMSMRGKVVKFRRALVILVMRSVVVPCGHRLKAPDLSGL